MSDPRDIDLVEDLRVRPTELSWLEFKKDNVDPDVIGKRCSALANAARIDGRDCGYMLWGIDDATHAVVGTRFDPDGQRVGGQELQLWLAQQLQPSVAFTFRVIDHPEGRVVMLEVPATTSAPVAFKNIAYIRIPESVEPALTLPLSSPASIFCPLAPYQAPYPSLLLSNTAVLIGSDGPFCRAFSPSGHGVTGD